MTLARLVARATRPAGLLCLALLATGTALAALDPTGALLRYPTLFWGSAGAALVLLGVVAALPPGTAARWRWPGFAGAGVLLSVLAGNGLTEGVARLAVGAGALAAFAVAVPALLLQMEAAQNRPVSRL